MTAAIPPHARGFAFTLVAGALLLSCTPEAAPAQEQRSQHHDYRVVPVVDGLEHPWGVAFLPGGDILVTERPGRLRLVRAGRLMPEPIAGVPRVYARGQGGLLDVAIHPQFASNRLVYLSYSRPGTLGATTAVIRGRLDGNRLVDVQDVIEARARANSDVHFGSRLVFDRHGYLFISVGERGNMQRAQDRSNHNGTILRLHDDGRVPRDNPFVGQANMRPEIFSYGHRNVQGMTLHPVTGELWATEHGPRGGDELNLVRAGRNYGWPVITFGIDYSGRPISNLTAKAGLEQPVHYWIPSIATSGTAIYDGDKFPRWRGDFFVGGLVGQQLARIRLDANHKVSEREQLLRHLNRRIRDVRNGPDGYLYVLTDEANGALLRVEPAAAR